MRLRLLAAVLLIAVGIGAVAVTMFPAGSSSGSGTRFVTSAATRTDVVKQVVATGTVAPVAVYSLAFGSQPTTGSSASSASSANSSSSSASSGSGSVTWNVLTVDATPGQAITKGTVLATADAGDAQLALTVAKANLAAAEAKLSSDRAGLSSTDRAAAALSVTQAQQSLSQARTAQSQTIAQNKLKVTQQSQAVSAAARKLADDTAAGADAVQIAQDQAAVTQARNALASLRLQVTQSNAQAANQVRSAQLQVQSAKLGFASRTAGATDAQIASDEAAVATARQSVDAAQTRVEGAALTSPVDGVVLTVNIAPGADAPSGAAITLQADTFAVSASVAESDLPSLVLGQAADITITATKAAATGVVTQISPAGSAGTGGGVVSYAITVSLPTPPKGTASGMSAQVSITTASAPGVLAVPSIALVTSGDGYAVRVLDGSGQPQAIPVEVGLITSSLAEIQGGIAEGTEVVVGTTSTRTGTTNPAGGFGGGFGGGGGGFPGGGTRGGG